MENKVPVHSCRFNIIISSRTLQYFSRLQGFGNLKPLQSQTPELLWSPHFPCSTPPFPGAGNRIYSVRHFKKLSWPQTIPTKRAPSVWAGQLYKALAHRGKHAQRERRAGLDHSNPNLRSASKAVQPQPKCVHSWRCTLWIFLCSRTCLFSHFMDSKEMPSKLQSSHKKPLTEARKLNLGLFKKCRLQQLGPVT